MKVYKQNPQHYWQIVQIWESFCKQHSHLYEKTCDEYVALLHSNLDHLEVIVADKEQHIREIGILEQQRSDLIQKINNELDEESAIKNVSGLLLLMQDFERSREMKPLFRLNKLLIDIIERIQGQNKKNQYFLNKAMISMKEINNQLKGKKNYQTYGATGQTLDAKR